MRILGIVILLLSICAAGNAQVAGDYQTAASGKWSAASTWQTYSGSAWGAASTAPTGVGTITLQAADSVDIDVAVTITGKLKSLGGRWGYSTGSLTFGNGGIYEHAANGAGIPTATWGTGSTCLVTGVVANAPSNASQDFYNFTWNCPGQTGTGVNVAWLNNTIKGNLRVMSTNNTGTSTSLRMTANGVPAPGVNTITILGDVLVDTTTAYLTSTGSSGADSIRVNVNGNIISRGVINLANGSGATCAWYVKGNVNILGGAFTAHSSTTVPDSLIFAKAGNQQFTKAGEIANLSNVRFRVLPGSLLDLDTNNVGASSGSSFTLDAGAAILTQHPSGLGGNLTNKLATTLSPDADYVFRGPVAQVDTLLPATVRSLTINNNVGVTLNKSVTVKNGLTLAVGKLSLGSNVITVNGTVSRTFGFVTSGLQKPVATSVQKTFEVGTAGGYAPVTITASAGSGTLTVTPVAGAHPSWPAAGKSLTRHWTLTASGITQADLTFGYQAGDAKGDETKYRAYRYTGSSWVMAAGSVNTTSHTVTATGVTSFSDWTCGESGAVSVDETAREIPREFFVDQNYPNPFNPSTTITYGLPQRAFVKAEVFSLLGQRVATLFEGEQPAGVHTIAFRPAELSSGMYLYRVQAGSSVMMKRMMLVR